MGKRYTEAQQIAEACSRLLTEQFGAERVIVFGSLAGQRPWHAGSDIDLAVRGLAEADYIRAYSACRELLPPHFELDLVTLETAPPELKARILQGEAMSNLSLVELVQDELTALERLATEMDTTLAQADNPPTRLELRAIASMLHEFYNAVERIFERVAVGLGDSMPQGSYWHTDLLTQMATATGERVAVIDEPLRARLKLYLDFRHFFRHAYGFDLEWTRMQWLAEELGQTLHLLRQQLNTSLPYTH